MDFLFIFNNEKISIYRCADDKLISLKYQGEESFMFDDNFWGWFKEKIDYQNEALSFVILNKDNFIVPNEIKLKKINQFCIEKIDFEYENIIAIPQKEIKIKKIEKKIKPIKKVEKNKITIVDFYKEETKKYEDK